MKLPRLPSKSIIIDGIGQASLQFQLWWQRVVEQIEAQFADLTQAISDIAVVQAEADANTAAVASLDTRVDALEDSAIPPGGLAGQVLSKIDGDDYNTEWVDQAASGAAGTATIDFGSTPSIETSLLVAAASCTATSRVDLWINPNDTTAENDAAQHDIAAYALELTPSPDVGEFSIIARSNFGLATGEFVVRYAL